MAEGKVHRQILSGNTSLDLLYRSRSVFEPGFCQVFSHRIGSEIRSLKNYTQAKYKKNWISLIPDILAVVAISARKALFDEN